MGGWVYPGESYRINEVGRETFTPRVAGDIEPADRAPVRIERVRLNGRATLVRLPTGWRSN